jgi:hypothetical protein
LSDGQIVGTPIISGSSQLNGVGYFFTAPTVSMDNQINWAFGEFGGSDTLRIHTSLVLPPSNPIPEPGSLTLLAVGGAAALARRRRARRTEK